jgi:ABC-type methionine transport system ATPase subunit
MIKKKIILGFPENIVKKPIVYKLVKDFELEFNILRAEITPDIEGKMLIDIKGSKEKIEQCLDFLKKRRRDNIRSIKRPDILQRPLCELRTLCFRLHRKSFYIKQQQL